MLPQWLTDKRIRPYLFVRPENRTSQPGIAHPLNWFEKKTLLLNPLKMRNALFAEAIYDLEAMLYTSSDMVMPRWVFYDCAIMPGITTGFAMHTDALSSTMRAKLSFHSDLEWVPISLFICIPTNRSGQWVAHNLCSVNGLLPNEEKLKGLGFLSKAYGLWYGNIKNLCGMTQWDSPALKLHSQYGNLEILTAYTPVHSYSATVTYRSWIDSRVWARFFSKKSAPEFKEFFDPAGFSIHPKNEESMKVFQRKIELKTGPYYLSSDEIAAKEVGSELEVYCLKDHFKTD